MNGFINFHHLVLFNNYVTLTTMKLLNRNIFVLSPFKVKLYTTKSFSVRNLGLQVRRVGSESRQGTTPSRLVCTQCVQEHGLQEMLEEFTEHRFLHLWCLPRRLLFSRSIFQTRPMSPSLFRSIRSLRSQDNKSHIRLFLHVPEVHS